MHRERCGREVPGILAARRLDQRDRVGTILEVLRDEWMLRSKSGEEKQMKDVDDKDLVDVSGGAPGIGHAKDTPGDGNDDATTNEDSPFSNDNTDKVEPG
jgi:hypothetical protein